MEVVSMFFVISGIVLSLFVYVDINKRSQSMKIMKPVWILTQLWASWLGIWMYFGFGRSKAKTMDAMKDAPKMNMDKSGTMNMASDMKMGDIKMNDMDMKMKMTNNMKMNNSHIVWNKIAISTLHCGAGCTLADIIGEWLTYIFPIYIFNSTIAGQWIIDYVLALIIGVYFQYAAIKPMTTNQSNGMILRRAFRIDFFSLTSWQIGMYSWMAIVIWAINNGAAPDKTSWVFWFQMQIAMLFGFAASYPTNMLLIKLGIKKPM